MGGFSFDCDSQTAKDYDSFFIFLYIRAFSGVSWLPFFVFVSLVCYLILSRNAVVKTNSIVPALRLSVFGKNVEFSPYVCVWLLLLWIKRDKINQKEPSSRGIVSTLLSALTALTTTN